jgi:uncharacterized protein YkwD
VTSLKICQLPDEGQPSGSRGPVAFAIMAILLLGALIVAIPYAPSLLKGVQGIFSQMASSVPGGSSGGSVTENAYSPLIVNGSANVAFPSDYVTLENYALQLINDDRGNFSLPPVALSSNQAGQQHVDSMLTYGYFSHWDTQGYKPYMRYTLLGGTGADAENVAFIGDSSAHFTTPSVEAAMKSLEYSMMYHDNDSTGCFCGNGHRDNILNPLHNNVSIGIAYDATHVYFDEEFENDYIALTFSVSSADYVTLTGTSLDLSVTSRVNATYIAYDPTPQPETIAQLDNGPHEYTPGTLVGGVLPEGRLGCPRFTSGVTVCTSTWSVDSSQFDVGFSLRSFIQAYGAGVYTIYLITGSDTNSAITSISVFIP